MDLRQIRQFMALAEGKYFYKAAEDIGLTQSALTQAISKLEKELGLQLFVRSKTGSILTEHGHRLYDHAKVIIGQFEAAETELKVRSQQQSAEISLGIIKSLSDDILLRVISEFKTRFPNYNIKIIKDWSETLSILLAEGEIDFAFLSDHFLSSDLLELKRDCLFKDEIQLVVGEPHKLYSYKEVKLADLSDHQWVAVSTALDWPEFLARIFTTADLKPPRHVIKTNSLTLATSLLQEGRAVGIASPKLFHSANMGSGTFKYFNVPELRQERSFSLCHRARMVIRPFHTYFIDRFKATLLDRIEHEGHL